MPSLTTLLAIYLLGGVTFVPLVLLVLFLHAYYTFPELIKEPPPLPLELPEDEPSVFKNIRDEKLVRRLTNSADAAAGYFLVTREFVPGGVNGKPPERTSPVGNAAPNDSPSVYQSVYRSLFDRKPTPTNASNDSLKPKPKPSRNQFYVVLRHGHLMLYDDEDQIEVRHVISLALYTVDIYGGGEFIPEGELYIRRNAIRLYRRPDTLDPADDSDAHIPFYMFSEDCSNKEDFYLALVKTQEKTADDPAVPPRPLRYRQQDIISLVQRLHSSEDHLHMNWINGLMGRVFLSVYKTPEVEDFFRAKITKKISRVNKPNFLSDIKLQRVEVGDATPYITNPRLKEMTAEGDFCVGFDVSYSGGFRLEFSTKATMSLGTRFKPRDVTLILAVVLKKLNGTGMIRIKPPPSNRLWFSFEKMPRMEMAIEPIVGSRQVVWGPIVRIIEGRIREVVAETLVLPYYDDIPFTNTSKQRFRGGIWRECQRPTEQQPEIKVPEQSPEAEAEHMETVAEDVPDLDEDLPSSLDSESGSKIPVDFATDDTLSASSNTASVKSQERKIRANNIKPVSPSSPSIGTEAINATAVRPSEPEDAIAAVTAIRTRSGSSPQSPSPIGTAAARGSKTISGRSIPTELRRKAGDDIDASSMPTLYSRSLEPGTPRSMTSLSGGSGGFGSTGSTPSFHHNNRANTIGVDKPNSAIGTATAAVKKWYANRKSTIHEERPHDVLDTAATESGFSSRSLPPAEIPPPPSAKVAPINVPKRKNLPPPPIPARKRENRKVPAPPLPSRDKMGGSSELLVVAAPDSEPTSPLDEQYNLYGHEAETGESLGSSSVSSQRSTHEGVGSWKQDDLDAYIGNEQSQLRSRRRTGSDRS